MIGSRFIVLLLTFFIQCLMANVYAESQNQSQNRSLNLTGSDCGPFKNSTIDECLRKNEFLKSSGQLNVRLLSDEQRNIDDIIKKQLFDSIRVGLNLDAQDFNHMRNLVFSSVTLLILSPADQYSVEVVSRNKSDLGHKIAKFGNEFSEHIGAIAALSGSFFYVSKNPDQGFELVETTALALATVFGLNQLGKLATNIKLPIDSNNQPLQWANTSNTHQLAFPSGHAAATATFLALIEKYWDLTDSKVFQYSAITIYAATMYGRLHDRQHFLSDVIFSGAFYFLAKGILNRDPSLESKQAFYIHPKIENSAMGTKVGVEFFLNLNPEPERPICLKSNGQSMSLEHCIDRNLNQKQTSF